MNIATVISKSKAAQFVDVDQMFNDVIEGWTTDYEYESASLESAVSRLIPGKDKLKVTKSRTRFVLSLNGEYTEIEYSFYQYPDGTVEFEPTHWHD